MPDVEAMGAPKLRASHDGQREGRSTDPAYGPNSDFLTSNSLLRPLQGASRQLECLLIPGFTVQLRACQARDDRSGESKRIAPIIIYKHLDFRPHARYFDRS